jgi:hypothetical protein
LVTLAFLFFSFNRAWHFGFSIHFFVFFIHNFLLVPGTFEFFEKKSQANSPGTFLIFGSLPFRHETSAGARLCVLRSP